MPSWHDARQLNGSATRSFRIYFGAETLPLICTRLEQARALAVVGQLEAAGKRYQALLVLSDLVALAIAMHATVEYADQVKELSLTLARTQETFGNQMEPLLEAALIEEPERLALALRDSAPAIQAWLQYLQRWTAHIQADAKRVVVAKVAWDITIGAIAAHETAAALAEAVMTGGPPALPAPAFGGGAATLELSGAAYVELVEVVRRFVASGALDAAVVAGLSPSASGHSMQMASQSQEVRTTPREAPSSLKGAQLQEYLHQAELYGEGGVKTLENGRIRFYGELTPARTPGEMAGRASYASGIQAQAPSEPGSKHSTGTVQFAVFDPRRENRRFTRSSTRMGTMSGRASAAPLAPSRAEVAGRLQGLAEGRYSRDEVASWAKQWVMADEPGISDRAVWRALQSMSSADLVSTDRPFLYGADDFNAWLQELKAASR